jgi:DnaA family protein
MSLPLQLTFNMQLKSDLTFANYCLGSNKDAVSLLTVNYDNLFDSIKSIVYLYGNPGVGLSHLLQASCHHVDAMGGRSMYLPMSQMIHYSPDVIEGVEYFDQVCIDDIGIISRIPKWEEAIFDLFNRAYDSKVKIIISSKKPPAKSDIKLKDLRSRLSWGVVFKINSLTDAEKLEAIKLRSKLQGHNLNEDVIRFLISRSKNDMHNEFNVLNKLDYASLKEKRKITIPFIKNIMSW